MNPGSLNRVRVGELVEPLERINYVLERDYPKLENRPVYRVVWANDLIEKRWVTHNEDGFEYVNPRVEERKKYKNDSVDRYVLERLTIIPEGVPTDLVDRLSYEPIWTFQDRHGNYLPPRLDACKIVIDQIESNINSAGHRPIIKDDQSPEAKKAELDRMEYILFGEETPITDALAYGSGVQGFHSKIDKENIH